MYIFHLAPFFIFFHFYFLWELRSIVHFISEQNCDSTQQLSIAGRYFPYYIYLRICNQIMDSSVTSPYGRSSEETPHILQKALFSDISEFFLLAAQTDHFIFSLLCKSNNKHRIVILICVIKSVIKSYLSNWFIMELQ